MGFFGSRRLSLGWGEMGFFDAATLWLLTPVQGRWIRNGRMTRLRKGRYSVLLFLGVFFCFLEVFLAAQVLGLFECFLLILQGI